MDSSKEGNVSKKRLLFLTVAVLCVFFIFAFYLFYIQVVQNLKYHEKALSVSRKVFQIPALRGKIFDRNYDVPIAENINSFTVSVILSETEKEKLPEMFSKLGDILNVSDKVLLKKISGKNENSYAPVNLKNRVSYKQICDIASQIENFPGITWENSPMRTYSHTKSLSHVIGYVGNITSDELHILYNKGYDRNSILGKSGIEKEYDMLLKGNPGKGYIVINSNNKKLTGKKIITEPESGKNLILTIDRHIQELAEKALADRMGSVVVLKPATGEILALVSYPSYDPNFFYDDLNSAYFREISLDSNYPFLNRAIQSSYAPASVFKTIMMTALLEEKAISPYEKINCTGSIRLGDRVFNCHKKIGHGRLNLSDALLESCDVYFWTAGREYLGVDKISEYARKMGLGAKTGIDIPGEISGVVPSPEWKEKQFNSAWVGGDTYNMSIGQGYTQVTPLQIADLIAMIVNEGTIYVPHLLKEVRDPVTGKVLEVYQPKTLCKADISSETFKSLKKSMRRVVSEGTVKVVFNTKAVQVAGKTGTGEVGYDDRWTSWFAAYGPYDSSDPAEQIVVVVMVEASNEWEWWAPKASNAIFQGIFADQSYEDVVKTLNIWYLNQKRDIIKKRNE